MNDQKILKVCKIDSMSFASFALKQQVDFFGVHVLKEEDIGKRFQLVEAIKERGGKVIIVTYLKDSALLQRIIEVYRPAGIQFHYEFDEQLVSGMRERNPGTLMFGVLTDKVVSPNFQSILKLVDYLIYDTSFRGGTGTENAYKHLPNMPAKLVSRTLLAGGIDPKRIRDLSNIEAAGFDVQSLFRKQCGLNFRNLENLCDLLKFPRKKCSSVSLTDIPLSEMKNVGKYFLDPNLDYHLDYSDASLYSEFNTTKCGIEEKERFLFQLPHSIHFFLDSNEKLRDRIDDFYEKFELSLTRVFIQYFPDIDCSLFTSQRKHGYEDKFNENILKVIPSVFYKDIDVYFERCIECDFMSIVVPMPEDKNKIEAFVQTFRRHEVEFRNKEVWLDRNLNKEYIKLFQDRLGRDFNYIVGKEVIADWTKLPAIHEQILEA